MADKQEVLEQVENGTYLKAAQAFASSEEQAAALLKAASRQRMETYNQGMVKLSEQTGYGVAAALTLPGGETVTLASWLKALGINAVPTVMIVPKGQ